MPEKKNVSNKTLTKSTNQFPVVGIGASAGGLEAFKRLLIAIPEKSNIAYVLVQHLDPTHESLLTEILQKVTTIPVLEISDDIKVEPGHIYILPSNKMLIANDGVLELSARPALDRNKRNLPIDLFFSSLAEVHQSHAIGVVLSGTASDGTLGLKAIKDHGGLTFAQDEHSAAYKGMPQSAVQAGVVDFVLSPEEIPKKIESLLLQIFKGESDDSSIPQRDEDVFRQVLMLLRVRRGIDFTYYRQTTIRRRILRRMALNKNEEPSEYLNYLRTDKKEQDILFQDLLISVTDFFRDPNVFSSLCQEVFPNLIKKGNSIDPIRIWVAGCSTGEEAYSIAICLKECLGDSSQKVQIFASDLSEPAISKARAGIYLKSDLGAVSAQRLREFFTAHNKSYQVNKEIRDMCVFAVHNFLKDPPFGKLDFISCRNVLIYMEPYLQKKAFTTFHYALNPGGILLLGKSETTSSVPDLFSLVRGKSAKHDKLFKRQDVAGRFMQVVSHRGEQTFNDKKDSGKIENMRNDFKKSADELILTKYTPPGAVVNEALDVVHFRGSTSDYLELSPGKPSLNILKLAKNGLAFELRNILHKAKKGKQAVRKDNVPVEINGQQHLISIEAVQLQNTIDPHYLILFHEQSWSDHPLPATKGDSKSEIKNQNSPNLRIEQLEKELAHMREDMRSITEDQEASNEELQSANEELLSGSEELQSLNKELETSKEELQSTIEELTVVNQEMLSLNEQVKESRDYAEAIVETITQPLLILDKQLRIKSANESFYKTYLTDETYTEGKLIYELTNKQWNIPKLKELMEKILPEKKSFAGYEVELTFPDIGIRTLLFNGREMKTENGTERLILLAIEDVTEIRLANNKIQESEENFRQLASLMPEKVIMADSEGNILYYNQNWLTYTGYTFDELCDFGWKRVIHKDDIDHLIDQWRHSLESGVDFELEIRIKDSNGKFNWHLSRSVPVRSPSGKILKWISNTTQIQEQKEIREELKREVDLRTYELLEKNIELEKMNKELESFTYVSSHDLQEPLRKIQTFAAHLLETENANLSDTGKDYFRRIQLAAKRMQNLIEDLLKFSRTSTGERVFETTDLAKIVQQVKNDLKEEIEAKQAVVEVGELCTVNIIEYQINQLLSNLIANALKFSSSDAPPRIFIESKIIKGNDGDDKRLISDSQYCHIQVRDNGIGFDQQYSDRVFEVFQRLHGKGKYPGTGIGLAIVKKIVENHNGFVVAKGEVGKGATFHIYLPTS